MLFGIQFALLRGDVLTFLYFVNGMVGRDNVAYRFLGANLAIRFNVRANFGRTRYRQAGLRRLLHPLGVLIFRFVRQCRFVSRPRVRDLLHVVLTAGRPSLANLLLSRGTNGVE